MEEVHQGRGAQPHGGRIRRQCLTNDIENAAREVVGGQRRRLLCHAAADLCGWSGCLGRREATARTMLSQSCGRHLGARAEALEALLVVHGDDNQREQGEGDEGWLRMWWNLLQPKLEVSGADPTASSSSAHPATRPTPVVDLDTQGSEEAPTQMDATVPPIMPLDVETLGNSELALIDAMLAEQEAEDAKKKAQEEFAHQENLRNQETEHAEQWLDAYGIEEARRRAEEVAARARAKGQAKFVQDLVTEWSARSERLLEQAEAEKKAKEQSEVDEFNRRVQAMAYRNWEEWVVLNTGPSGGYTSLGNPATGTRKRAMQVEAFVQQGGVTIGKRARWQLEINETRPLMVQFQIGVRGTETDTLNAKSAMTSVAPGVSVADMRTRGSTVGGLEESSGGSGVTSHGKGGTGAMDGNEGALDGNGGGHAVAGHGMEDNGVGHGTGDGGVSHAGNDVVQKPPDDVSASEDGRDETLGRHTGVEDGKGS